MELAPRDILLAAFAGVNDYSPDGIMACWEREGVYDNPMVGQAAEGFEAVRACMVNLVDGLRAKGQSLVVDRVTVGERHVLAEWHVEPRDGRRGVHVTEFGDHGKLRRVTVYPRAN
ncbi:MAG: nuclear transport factor 2 family protein [Tepidisphaeraceae bacterium]